jgi:hypothetical protein
MLVAVQAVKKSDVSPLEGFEPMLCRDDKDE